MALRQPRFDPHVAWSDRAELHRDRHSWHSDPHEMSTRLGKYHLIKQIAQGGMAEVFLAKQRGPAGFEQEVVVKRILPSRAQDPHFVEMFLSEARVAAAMSHPNIVQIVELGEHEGTYFIVMEAVRGVSVSQLNDRLASFGLRVPEPFACRIVSHVCAGLGYAHNYFASPQQRGVLHGDVSPDNILVSYNGAVKVIDFGLARAADDADRRDKKTVHGKMRYMAPEGTEGRPVDARSDLFSLAIVLYETLTGAHPFGSETGLAAAAANARNDPRPPRDIVPDLPLALERILELGLKRDPEERYVSADLMRRDLEAYLRSSATHVEDAELGEFVSSVVRGGDDDLEWLRSWGAMRRTTESGLVRDAGKRGGVGVASGHLAPTTDSGPRSVPASHVRDRSAKGKRAAWFVLLGLALAVVTWGLASSLWAEPQGGEAQPLSVTPQASNEGSAGVAPPVPTLALSPHVDDESGAPQGAHSSVSKGGDGVSAGATTVGTSPPVSEVLVSPTAAQKVPVTNSRLGRVEGDMAQHRSGTIQVTSNAAGARVSLDGRDVGSVPVSLSALEGEHQIVVSAAGVTRQRTLSVGHGDVEVFRAEFASGQLAIKNVPVGVVCLLDGRPLARKSWSDTWLPLTEGRHALVCDDPSGEVHSQAIDIIGEQRYTFTWPL
jgi:serine/threonine protein kinase